jgi:hypothetical protein
MRHAWPSPAKLWPGKTSETVSQKIFDELPCREVNVGLWMKNAE